MRALPLLLLSLLFPIAAAATVADLDVRVVAPKRAGEGARVHWTTVVRNNGPDTVQASIKASNNPFFAFTCAWTRTFAVGEEISLDCSTDARKESDGRMWLSGNAQPIAATDPDLTNNGKVEFVDVVSAPDLVLALAGPSLVLRDTTVSYFVSVTNSSAVPAPASTVIIDLDPRLRIVSATPACIYDNTRSRLTCSIASLPQGTSSFRVDTRGPAEGAGVRLVTRAELRTDDPTEVSENGNTAESVSQTFRTFFITNIADSGSGSLRGAIESANAVCNDIDAAPCELAFAIDQPDARWSTIRPRAPLPALTAQNVLFDATSQQSVRGDTNSDGPEIEISGADASAGDGLVVDAACSATVRGLTINGFAGGGLVLRASSACRAVTYLGRTTANNYLGTDATGSTAIPNERGLVVEGGASWSITENVISGNRRSGVFLSSGPNSRIARNRIGFRAHQDLPLGNLGSGIFIGPAAFGTDLDNNYVTYNREHGIAVAAEYVRIGFNSIHANGLLGIDVGLDGPGGSITVPPRITSATYDPATGLTTIEGIGTRVGSFGPDEVLVYANDACDRTGAGEGQYTLGRALHPDFQSPNFRFIYPGDLTGKSIAATTTVNTCMGCFQSNSVEANGTDFLVFTRTTEFGPCRQVVAVR